MMCQHHSRMLELPDVTQESYRAGVALPERLIGRRYVPYGTYQVAATYCGYSSPPAEFRGEWQHGWVPPDSVIHPEMVTAADGLSRHRRLSHSILVARADEEQYLREQGFQSVHSVGLPIVYGASPDTSRHAGSLLVMPVHSLEYTKHDWNFEAYADEIDAVRSRFSKVVACVSASCFRRGYWVDAFERRGIPVISGADIFDANTFRRLACLFGHFEFMTTNGFGSHLVYAALFGAKPSIYGTIAPLSADDFKDDAFYQHNPETVRMVVDMSTPEALRSRFEDLFLPPWTAPERAEWGRFQAGMQCKRDPDELRRLLGWENSSVRSARVRRVVSAVTRRTLGLASRLYAPSDFARDQVLATLENTAPGDEVAINAPWGPMQTENGPRLAFELSTYLYGDAGSLRVNPVDAPGVDLNPRDGAALLALAEHHPFRTMYYWPNEKSAGDLRRNLDAHPRAAGRVVPLTPQAAGVANLHEDWEAFRQEFKETLGQAAVLKLAVSRENWREILSRLDDFPSCRLLLLECEDRPESYLGDLLARLGMAYFVPRFDGLQTATIRQAGFLSPRTILALPLTRSGLDLPSYRFERS